MFKHSTDQLRVFDCRYDTHAFLTTRQSKGSVSYTFRIRRAQLRRNVPEEFRKDTLERLGAWGMADNGGPVYVLNLMRTRETSYLFPGAPMDFQGTAEEGNRIYEDHAMPLVFKRRAIPSQNPVAHVLERHLALSPGPSCPGRFFLGTFYPSLVFSAIG